MEAESRFTEQQLWEKYLRVTKEMLKFVNEEDIDTFLDLVGQRQRLMETLQQLPSHDFARSPAGIELREQIKPMDMQISYKARAWLNKSRQNNAAVKSYDMTGFMAAGNVLNREY